MTGHRLTSLRSSAFGFVAAMERGRTDTEAIEAVKQEQLEAGERGEREMQ